MATLWVVPGGYDEFDDDAPNYDELEHAVKIVGPIETKVGLEIFESVKQMLGALGHNVQVVETADD